MSETATDGLDCKRNAAKEYARPRPRTSPKSNMQVSQGVHAVRSGQKAQGSTALGLWLPRETACTEHLVNGDARARPFPDPA